MVSIEVVFLGTSAAMPTAERSLSSIVINRNSSLFIFDAGEGMQYNYIRAKLGFNKKTTLFVTHMHSDHILGILGFLQTLSLQGRKLPIDIFGPSSLQDFIVENIKILKIRLSFDLNIHTISGSHGVAVDDGEYMVLFCMSEHGPGICSFAYSFIEKDRPGKFDIKKAKSLDLPEGELYRLLQQGNDIVFGKRIIYSKDIVGRPRPGRKIGISGDTRPSDSLRNFFMGCDLLVFESTFMSNEIDKAKESFHSTAFETATLAKDASVHKLYMTHFSSRYKDLTPLLNEARSVFFNTELAFDLKVLTIDYIDSKLDRENI